MIRIKPHSVVDIITNSSTMIYTQATPSAIKVIKEIINTILKDAGSDKTVDDLYDVEISEPKWDMNYAWVIIQENPESFLYWGYYDLYALASANTFDHWNEIEKLMREQLTNEQLAEILEYACETYIVIKNKVGTDSPISEQLTMLFSSEEVSSEG